MYVCMYACMYACMYVCMCLFIFKINHMHIFCMQIVVLSDTGTLDNFYLVCSSVL